MIYDKSLKVGLAARKLVRLQVYLKMGNCFSSKSAKRAPVTNPKIWRRRTRVAPCDKKNIGNDSIRTLQSSSHFLYPAERPPFFTWESIKNAKKTISDFSRSDSSPDSLFGHSSVVTRPASPRVETAGVMGGRLIIVQPCASGYTSFSDDSLPGEVLKRPIYGRESRSTSLDAEDLISSSGSSFTSLSENSLRTDDRSQGSFNTDHTSMDSLRIEDLSDDE